MLVTTLLLRFFLGLGTGGAGNPVMFFVYEIALTRSEPAGGAYIVVVIALLAGLGLVASVAEIIEVVPIILSHSRVDGGFEFADRLLALDAGCGVVIFHGGSF